MRGLGQDVGVAVEPLGTGVEHGQAPGMPQWIWVDRCVARLQRSTLVSEASVPAIPASVVASPCNGHIFLLVHKTPAMISMKLI